MTIAVDFDGTITQESNWPIIGKLNPVALTVIDLLIKKGHLVYLWTVREFLYKDKVWNILRDAGCQIEDPDDWELPIGFNGKLYADFYIDDKAIPGHLDWSHILSFIENELPKVTLNPYIPKRKVR